MELPLFGAPSVGGDWPSRGSGGPVPIKWSSSNIPPGPMSEGQVGPSDSPRAKPHSVLMSAYDAVDGSFASGLATATTIWHLDAVF
ncbi:MAG: hypothetical protein IH823_01260 [Candidatus Dadabacteria bacterium]|nr:hypothetical protein [Candidatus Dadabacteria bacterium]